MDLNQIENKRNLYMTSQEYLPLVKKLLDVTKQSKCKWLKVDDAGKYYINISNNIIEIDKFVPYDSSPIVVLLEIYNNEGGSIGTLSESEDEADFGTLNELYEAVRDNALKISSTINDIMRGLEEM